MDARLRRGPLPRPGQAQPAVEVVREQRGEAGQQDHRGGEADEELQQRQGEDVEADVEAELRVLGAERRAVQPQLDGLPLPGGRGAREQAEHDGHGEADQAAQRLQLLAVAVERLLPRRRRRVDRPGPEGERQAAPHGQRHDQRRDDEQPGLGEQPRPQHLDVAELAEPQDLGPQLREQHEQEHDRAQDRRAWGPARRGGGGRAGHRPVREALGAGRRRREVDREGTLSSHGRP